MIKTMQQIFKVQDYNNHKIFMEEFGPDAESVSILIMIVSERVDQRRLLSDITKLWERVLDRALINMIIDSDKIRNILNEIHYEITFSEMRSITKINSLLDLFEPRECKVTKISFRNCIFTKDLDNLGKIVTDNCHLRDISFINCLMDSYHSDFLQENNCLERIVLRNCSIMNLKRMQHMNENLLEFEMSDMKIPDFSSENCCISGYNNKKIDMTKNNLQEIDLSIFLLERIDSDFSIDLRDNPRMELKFERFVDMIQDSIFTEDKADVYLDIFSNLEEIILVDDHLKERLKVIKEEGLRLF